MLYLLWSLLNMGLLIWFLLISISVFKLVKEKLGIPALIVFILGCLSFTNDRITNKESLRSNGKDTVMGLQLLEDGIAHDITLTYSYPKDTLDRGKGLIYQTGIVSGHHWNTVFVTFYKSEGNVHYEVDGDHEWKLLGLTLYNERKQFTGVIKQ